MIPEYFFCLYEKYIFLYKHILKCYSTMEFEVFNVQFVWGRWMPEYGV